MSFYRSALFVLLTATASIPGLAASSAPTGWSPVIVPTGEYREHIQSIPIEQRPGRPLHVYGNTVRLMRHAEATGVNRPLRQIFLGTPQMPANARSARWRQR